MEDSSIFKPIPLNVLAEHSLPERFTYPFNYQAHPLSLYAAEQIQDYLKDQADWEHDFGIDTVVEDEYAGKMFGVLIVQGVDGVIGYLSGFSGKLADNHVQPGFVPPVYDLYTVGSFYKKEEEIIMAINGKVIALESSVEWKSAHAALADVLETSARELAVCQQMRKQAKRERAQLREEARTTLDTTEYATLEERLINESLKLKYDFKTLRREWGERKQEAQHCVDQLVEVVAALKQERKGRSIVLQQQLFDQYQFLNSRGELRGVCDIFKETPQLTPPSGAGECAAPKLFQYAFTHGYTPLALAEFWWGQSPRTEIRKHGLFYPSCKGKCEPILGHMLDGIVMDPNPVLNIIVADKGLSVLYEDDQIALVNKPSGLLTTPGREIEDSVYRRAQVLYPDATGPMMVHRLDMATSGILIIAKTKLAHKALQRQFLKKVVKKQYAAVLEGNVEQDSGTIELPLCFDYDNRPRQKVCFKEGKPAITEWKVVKRERGRTWVHFFPITGRTHQLRVHAAHTLGLNRPIVGDMLYGSTADRLHLHAEHITFIHPTTGESFSFTKPASF
ncbi:MAG: RluA family pseudouridine synthase [Fibrobacterales bacterium]